MREIDQAVKRLTLAKVSLRGLLSNDVNVRSHHYGQESTVINIRIRVGNVQYFYGCQAPTQIFF